MNGLFKAATVGGTPQGVPGKGVADGLRRRDR